MSQKFAHARRRRAGAAADERQTRHRREAEGSVDGAWSVRRARCVDRRRDLARVWPSRRRLTPRASASRTGKFVFVICCSLECQCASQNACVSPPGRRQTQGQERSPNANPPPPQSAVRTPPRPHSKDRTAHRGRTDTVIGVPQRPRVSRVVPRRDERRTPAYESLTRGRPSVHVVRTRTTRALGSSIGLGLGSRGGELRSRLRVGRLICGVGGGNGSPASGLLLGELESHFGLLLSPAQPVYVM